MTIRAGTDLAPLTTVGNLVSFKACPERLGNFDEYFTAIPTFVRLFGCGHYVW